LTTELSSKRSKKREPREMLKSPPRSLHQVIMTSRTSALLKESNTISRRRRPTHGLEELTSSSLSHSGTDHRERQESKMMKIWASSKDLIK
jgi:hypothetical protein